MGHLPQNCIAKQRTSCSTATT